MASFVMALSQLLHDMDLEYGATRCAPEAIQGHCGPSARIMHPGASDGTYPPFEASAAAGSVKRRNNRILLKKKRSDFSKSKSSVSPQKVLSRDWADIENAAPETKPSSLDTNSGRLRTASLAHLLTPPICFTSDGSAFVIHDTKRLESILPRYFGTNVYRSFHRQLNMYSFHSLTPLEKHHADLPTSAKVFRHEYFHRDADEATLSKIRRKQPRIADVDNVKWEPTDSSESGPLTPCSNILSPLSAIELPLTPNDYPFDGDAQDQRCLTSSNLLHPPVWGVGPPPLAWPLTRGFFEPFEYSMNMPPGSCRLIDVAPPPPEMMAYYLAMSCQSPCNFYDRAPAYDSATLPEEMINADISQILPFQCMDSQAAA